MNEKKNLKQQINIVVEIMEHLNFNEYAPVIGIVAHEEQQKIEVPQIVKGMVAIA